MKRRVRINTIQLTKIRKHICWRTAVITLVILCLFLANAFHEKYPDEFDSLVGGKYILEGKLPYRDWFQHHQPFAYIVSAGILSIVGNSFVRFRIALSLLYFGITVGPYWLFRTVFPKKSLSFYLPALLILGFGATYTWLHMLLADSLAAWLLFPAITLIILIRTTNTIFSTRLLLFFSLSTFFTWLTSSTYTYALIILSLYAGYLFVVRNPPKVRFNRRIWSFVTILGTPYLLFLTFLIVTGSAADYYFAAVTYNKDYYIYNYPRAPGSPFNPLRYAVIIAHDFFLNFYAILWQVRGFAFENPVKITLALSNVAFAIVMFIKKYSDLAIVTILTLIYINARGNPDGIVETDYQMNVYIVLSVIVGLYTLYLLWNYLNKKLAFSHRLVYSFLLILLGVHWFFLSLFYPVQFTKRFYRKYMGFEPLIYDRPSIAGYVNAMVRDGESTWIGPFEFEELFYVNAPIASKYHWFLQHAESSEKIRGRLVSDIKTNKPTVIVFDREYAPWGGDASDYNYFFTDILDADYFRISGSNEIYTEVPYVWNIADELNFEIDTHFYLLRDKKNELIQRLLEMGYIKKVEESEKAGI